MEVPWRKENEREAGASTLRLAWPGKLVPGSRLDREGLLHLPGPWAVPKEEAQKGGKQSKAEERAGEQQPGGRRGPGAVRALDGGEGQSLKGRQRGPVCGGQGGGEK